MLICGEAFFMAMYKLTKAPRLFVAFVLLVVLGLSSPNFTQQAASADRFPEEGKVAKVVDGDTVVLSTGEKIRYLGINAPEVRVRRGRRWIYRRQPLGKEATAYNRELVSGKSVSLEYDKKMKDDYGRLLAYVKVGDLFVNGELVRQGLALVDVRKPNYRYQTTLLALQEEAREQCQGIWGAFLDHRVEADEAYRHIDTLSLVHGRIASVRFSKGKLMLIFGQGKQKGFTAIIFREHLQHFPLGSRSFSEFFCQRRANVYGFIKDMNGPTVVICAPTQIDLLEEP
jgi:endonuclease YncB( thermonuclease family)